MTADVIQNKVELMIELMMLKNISFSGCDNYSQS